MSNDWYIKLDNKTESDPILGPFSIFCDGIPASASQFQGDSSPPI